MSAIWFTLETNDGFHQYIRYFCSTVCHYSFNLMLPLVCHVKCHLNARATEILAHTVDSCFETTNMMCATSGKIGVEKYSGKGTISLLALLGRVYSI